MKNIKKYLLLLVMAIVMVGCNNDNQATTTDGGNGAAPASDKGTIGLVIHSQDDDWSKSFAANFEKAVKEAGYDYSFLNPNGDLETQISNIESFTQQGVKGMSIIPLDVDAIVPAVTAARDAGVKIIAEGPSTDYEMTSDSYGGGQMSAKALVEAMGEEGKIAIIDITAQMPGVRLRTQGFKDYIAQYPNIEIVEENRAGTLDETIATAENIYTAHPDLDGIFGSFGIATIGAARAAKNMDKSDLKIVGIDGDKEIMRMIDEGWIVATASQNPLEQSARSVENLIEQIEGRDPEEHLITVDHLLVDKSNFKEVWKDLYGEEYSPN